MSLRTPTTDGPDVIYTGDDWDAYANGTHCGTFPNSQDAWSAARAAAFATDEHDDGLDCASCSRFPCICCPRCASYPCCCASVPEDDGVRLTHKRTEICDVWRYGTADVWVPHDDPTEPINLGIGNNDNATTWAEVRDVYRLLAQPQFQQLMGLVPVAPTIEVEPQICDDDLDLDYGQPTATAYRYGTAEAYFPLAPDPQHPHNVPMLFVNEWITFTIADAYRLLPLVTTLLASPEVQQAWQRWQEQSAAQQQTVEPDIYALACRIADHATSQYPDDRAARMAAIEAIIYGRAA